MDQRTQLNAVIVAETSAVPLQPVDQADGLMPPVNQFKLVPEGRQAASHPYNPAT